MGHKALRASVVFLTVNNLKLMLRKARNSNLTSPPKKVELYSLRMLRFRENDVLRSNNNALCNR